MPVIGRHPDRQSAVLGLGRVPGLQSQIAPAAAGLLPLDEGIKIRLSQGLQVGLLVFQLTQENQGQGGTVGFAMGGSVAYLVPTRLDGSLNEGMVDLAAVLPETHRNQALAAETPFDIRVSFQESQAAFNGCLDLGTLGRVGAGRPRRRGQRRADCQGNQARGKSKWSKSEHGLTCLTPGGAWRREGSFRAILLVVETGVKQTRQVIRNAFQQASSSCLADLRGSIC